MSIANTNHKTIIEDGIIEENDQVQARVAHLKELEKLVGNTYPNKFERTKISGAEDTITNIAHFAPIVEIVKELKENTPEGEKPDQELKARLNEKLKEFGNVRISGRLAVPPRVMGKAAFVHLSDGKNRLQIYVRKDDAKAITNYALRITNNERAEEQNPQSANRNPQSVSGWELFGFLDHGDFIGVEGWLFLTNTGELSVHVETLQFLSKALMPMPDKMHGIADTELRRRFRYADLIADSLKIDHEENELTTREVFERRAKLISGMRNYLDAHGYIEVETPMLTPKATGAAAKPFSTHHNALDLTLYARIAPELYLKRLLVGGFEKVYELNRNFRNEGLSHKHNPEFTMLEFYCAYMDVNGMMDFAEAMIQESVKNANKESLQVRNKTEFHEHFYLRKKIIEIDFSNFKRLTMKQAVLNKISFVQHLAEENIESWIDKNGNLKVVYDFLIWLDEELIGEEIIQNDIKEVFEKHIDKEKDIKNKWNELNDAYSELQLNSNENEKIIVSIFENFVEQNLGRNKIDDKVVIYPTFIIDYPKSISPLSKASPANPQIAERFELFINGMECANGFSELNDPQEQYERFIDQMRERETGDEEAMVLDEDYIRALAYGMPPAAGIGIGIDRLVMILTNRHSIRDVILFPHMRPERKDKEKRSEGEDEKK